MQVSHALASAVKAAKVAVAVVADSTKAKAVMVDSIARSPLEIAMAAGRRARRDIKR
jgi:hypothetical protein